MEAAIKKWRLTAISAEALKKAEQDAKAAEEHKAYLARLDADAPRRETQRAEDALRLQRYLDAFKSDVLHALNTATVDWVEVTRSNEYNSQCDEWLDSLGLVHHRSQRYVEGAFENVCTIFAKPKPRRRRGCAVC